MIANGLALNHSSAVDAEELMRRQRVTTATTLRRLAAWGIPVAGRRIVDLGCGSGGGTLAFGVAGAKVHGIDQRDTAFALARSSGPQVRRVF